MGDSRFGCSKAGQMLALQKLQVIEVSFLSRESAGQYSPESTTSISMDNAS